MSTERLSVETLPGGNQPIRAELFSQERLAAHAASLAAAQADAVSSRPGKPVMPRVLENGRILRECHGVIARSLRLGTAVTPAAEWLADNFHVVDEQLREIQDDLPRGYYRRLPTLASGHLQGYPRVIGVAWAFVAHMDSRFDLEALRGFVRAYQSVQPLTIGELWAVPITLRITLVENLRRLAEGMVHARVARGEADRLADRLLGVGGAAESPETVLRRLEPGPVSADFAVQLAQRLRDLDPKARPALLWLNQRLGEQGTTAGELIRAEQQQQGAANMTVRNIITAMRSLSALDWPVFFESVSLVDACLRRGDTFARMDFATRDAYRHAIEDLARESGLTEVAVAEQVMQRAKAGNSPPQTDSGYCLIGGGRLGLERELGCRVPWRRRWVRAYVRAGLAGYLGSVIVITVLALALPLYLTHDAGPGGTLLAPLVLLASLAASELALALVNRSVSDVLGPRRLPRLELPDGPTPELRTLVVMPTLLASLREVEEDLGRLEVHYLANSEGEIHFALLSDWLDAREESAASDTHLLAAAMAGIARLNERHGVAPGGQRFLLMHRRRVWNASQNKWMGWERKRGKLRELNQLLRGASNTSFLSSWDRVPPIARIRYVITLDTDTRLPRGAASRLIGTMAHPLNQPRFEAGSGRIVGGYGIVQPRITPLLPNEGEGSFYQRVTSGPGGMDPYTAAVSDVYQDLFREGSYTGKGIYEVDAFEKALAGKVPANSMLSHDLFEGIFARAALATDIEFFEEFPSRYAVAAARQHRWARGDWQLLPWLMGRGQRGARPLLSLPGLGRWKILDNLRRTLLAPATLLAFLLAWLLPLKSAWVWSGFLLTTLAVPPLVPWLAGLSWRARIGWRIQIRGGLENLGLAAAQFGLAVTFLAYQAWLMSDAILRTLGRLLLTHRNLLEWLTAGQARGRMQSKMWGAYSGGPGSVVLAAVALAELWLIHGRVWLASPLLLLWAAAPALARTISQPPRPSAARPLSGPNQHILRGLARRTWYFFETFVTPSDHALPPDGWQQDPKPTVAHRTSPTNMGLYLLATAAAHDCGWLGTLSLVERLEATLTSMSQLERHRGHFYNWYDTTDLHPLEPRYISAVDSGNLAGHLVALKNACHEFKRSTLNSLRIAGILDGARLLGETQARLIEASAAAAPHEFTRALGELTDLLATPLDSANEWAEGLVALTARAQAVSEMSRAWLATPRNSTAAFELNLWASAVATCVASHCRDAELLLPWMRLPAAALRTGTWAACWQAIEPHFRTPSLADTPMNCALALQALAQHRAQLPTVSPRDAEATAELDALEEAFRKSAAEAAALLHRLDALAQTAANMIQAMDFAFLFDSGRKLLSLGYRVAEGSLDPACYDLLASEARLASFIAIAKGDVPTSHWYRLSRILVTAGGGAALLSWSGSMFEYLMPEIVMQPPAESLLRQTCRQIVRRQRAYGAERQVAWGISESAYNARDLQLTYQYSSFGVPGLGLKRGLADDLVIAPYATALAAMIEPEAAVANFARLAGAGSVGTFGFYDALDYTPSRVPPGQRVAVVRAYLAHHQGMTLVALSNVLNQGVMRRRFHSEPMVRAAELLLQERQPRGELGEVIEHPRAEEVSAIAQARELAAPAGRRISSPHTAAPQTHLLSNGRYQVMVTAAGSGYSRWRGLALTRWREDATRDCWGSYIYLRDIQSGEVWSAGYQPSGKEAASYQAAFYEDRAEITRRDGALITTTEIVVSAEDDAELRCVSITNRGISARELEITSYAELVLAPQAADAAHPAFSNLFVETEFSAGAGALLATRRRRSEGETPVWVAHLASVEGATEGELSFETDRGRFLGRGHDIRGPAAMAPGGVLSNMVGAVLDPVLSLRRTLRIPTGATARVIFTTAAASTREAVLDLADKYRGAGIMERTLALAWTQAQVQLQHLGVKGDEAQLFQSLAGPLLYLDGWLRPPPEVLGASSLDRAGLWAHGISGDLPILLACIEDAEELGLIREVLRAHEYWQTKQFAADVIILNEKPASYACGLRDALEALLRGSQSRLAPDPDRSRGGIQLLHASHLLSGERALLAAAARVVLRGRQGTLAEQLGRVQRRPAQPPPAGRARRVQAAPPAAVEGLAFFNGVGGFADEGREYVITAGAGVHTPAPWVNVIANSEFGFIVSESGSGYTWSLNSHENQITPWSNDPVADPAGEAMYVKDEDSGEVWCPTALPIRDHTGAYTARHGQGYSRFEHASRGIELEMLQFVPPEDAIKISRLRLRNVSGRPRRLTVTAYAEWVLGSSRGASAPYLVTEADPLSGALFARSSWQGEFGGRIAFADLAGLQTAWTGDRREFLGRNGGLGRPAALEREKPLSGAVGAGLDPCTALQAGFRLEAGASRTVVFFLGQGANREDARQLLTRYRAADLDAVWQAVTAGWNGVVGGLQATTPDPALDLLLNRWLLYQTLSCRVWGRTGFYQASGAYGFRDQLQDGMALCVARPQIAREHLLRAAGRQFVEGDVQHWWHPPSGRGVRTRIADDPIWLAYAVHHYVRVTGDEGALEEQIPFLEGEKLAPGQEDAYFQPTVSPLRATLFEHCARALDRGLAVGRHGLPLIGTGDWNDGLNRVGSQGQGESVWLGWFLHATLGDFAKLADARGERGRGEAWRLHLSALKAALEREAWDGAWYLRAFYDDGTPLGSAANEECRIASIAQSWGVISGAAEPARGARAMAAVARELVCQPQDLVLLLSPPFDRMPRDPGYIKAYVPGVRENGGQYTHGAVWAAIAFAALGDGDTAARLLRMLNPIHRSCSPAEAKHYRVEPYAVAGDVCSEPPHAGRGGWTWYTGSAGWFYRAGMEWILGFRLRGGDLHLDPCIPREWPGYSLRYRHHTAVYAIRVENPRGVNRGIASLRLDGKPLPCTGPIALADDGQTHQIQVILG